MKTITLEQALTLENIHKALKESCEHEIIYNIYVGDYHYETAIDEEGLAFLMHEAKERAQGRPIRVEKEKISIEEMNSIMQAKIDDNEKIWGDAKKTKNPAEYVERYWLLKDIEKEKALAIDLITL